MNELLLRSWWMLALYGVIALLFGVFALVWPGLTLLWLVALFATYSLVGGALLLVIGAINRKTDEKWWLILLLGLVSIAAGVVAIFQPGLTALALVLVMGVSALMSGVLDAALGIRLRKEIRGEWLLITGGIVSIVFGVLVLLFPDAGALALIWLISFYAIFTGVLFLALAFRARSWAKTGRQHKDFSVAHP